MEIITHRTRNVCKAPSRCCGEYRKGCHEELLINTWVLMRHKWHLSCKCHERWFILRWSPCVPISWFMILLNAVGQAKGKQMKRPPLIKCSRCFSCVSAAQMHTSFCVWERSILGVWEGGTNPLCPKKPPPALWTGRGGIGLWLQASDRKYKGQGVLFLWGGSPQGQDFFTGQSERKVSVVFSGCQASRLVFKPF